MPCWLGLGFAKEVGWTYSCSIWLERQSSMALRKDQS